MQRFYPQLDNVLIFKNNISVGNFFKLKDVIPHMLCSSVAYKFSYAQRNVMPLAVGRRTSLRHELRNAEHRGISSRTGFPLQISNIRILDHALTTGREIAQNNFQIVNINNIYDLTD